MAASPVSGRGLRNDCIIRYHVRSPLPTIIGVAPRSDPAMPDDPNALTLRGEYVTLAQAVKVVGLADSGGQAKFLVRTGEVRVNGAPETQPGRKLRAGDRFGHGEREWTVTA